VEEKKTLTLGPVVVRKQQRYCARTGAPFFMPLSGRCFSCRRDITRADVVRRRAAVALITGCPHCQHSFVD
jgi:hypothetical protein